MEEWKEYRLEELTIGKGEYGIGASAVPFDSSKYTYLRITDINDDGTLNKQNLMSVDDINACNYILKKNDIVFARTGNSTGRSYFYDGSDGVLVYAGFLIKFSIDDNKVNPRILKYYTHSKPYFDWVHSFDTGGTRGNINAKTYGTMPIILPSRKIQDKIVSILKFFDDKIELNRRINENLEQQAQALFKSWFVDFEPFKDGKFVDSELGMIPEGWRINLVKDIAIFTQGTQVPISMQYNTQKENMIRFIRIVDYTSNNTELPRFIYKTNKQTECDESDVIMVRYGNIGTIGRRLTGVIANNLFKISPSNILTKNFLYYFFKQKEIQELIVASAAGSAMPAIKHSTIGNINIIVPPKGIVNMFDLICNSYEAQILKNNQENSYLKEVRDTLLPKLMSGELAITDVEDRSIFQ